MAEPYVATYFEPIISTRSCGAQGHRPRRERRSSSRPVSSRWKRSTIPTGSGPLCSACVRRHGATSTASVPRLARAGSSCLVRRRGGDPRTDRAGIARRRLRGCRRRVVEPAVLHRAADARRHGRRRRAGSSPEHARARARSRRHRLVARTGARDDGRRRAHRRRSRCRRGSQSDTAAVPGRLRWDGGRSRCSARS